MTTIELIIWMFVTMCAGLVGSLIGAGIAIAYVYKNKLHHKDHCDSDCCYDERSKYDD